MIDFLVTYETPLRFGVNIAAMMVLIFGTCYRRYKDKELVTAASLFNVFAFGVLSILSSVQFSVAAGFGLFAILALFTLRSEQISKIEITYFFGSVAIAVICAIPGTSPVIVGVVLGMVLLGAYVFDHPLLLRSSDGVKLTLDKIEPHILSDPSRMRADLSKRLGVKVMTYQILMLDYINDLARINAFFRKPK